MPLHASSIFPRQRAPIGYGCHPNFRRSYRRFYQKLTEGFLKGEFYAGHKVTLTKLPKSGNVYLVPRNKYINVIDEFGDMVAVGNLDKAIFPFSSYDFYADISEEDYFKELLHYAFYRLGEISQLGYLVPPRPEDWNKSVTISYLVPAFPHTRWAHSRLVAFMMEAILAKNGFREKERFPAVLVAAYHDVAIPAGGDSVKRIAKELDEENNFAWLLAYHGLIKEWSEKYGFNIEEAKRLVKNQGLFGEVLDIIDKMAYTALDCYYIGFNRPCDVRSFGTKNPLVMDVWQDVKINKDRSEVGFTDPKKLFNFLLFRAYEHKDLLMNPYSRALDFFLHKMAQPLYEKGIITREQLLTNGDDWLHKVLQKHYPRKGAWIIVEPEKLSWKKFDSLADFNNFCAKNERVDHTEHIKGFNLGLDFGVCDGNRITSARSVFSREQIGELEEINRQVKGYYIYYGKE